MKYKFLSLFLSIQILFIPVFVYAEDNIPKITHLEKGEKAPFEGSLLNKQAQAQVLADKENTKDECKLREQYLLNREKAKCDLLVNNAKITHEMTEKKLNEILKIKDKEIDRTHKIALKNSKNNTPIWVIGGFVGGVVATVAMFLLVKEVSNK